MNISNQNLDNKKICCIFTSHSSQMRNSGLHIVRGVCTEDWRSFLSSSTDTTSRSLWHVNPVVEGGTAAGAETWDNRADSNAGKEGSVRDFAEATATQSHNLMITAATRVWEELYITKKPAIEEVSSITGCLSFNSSPCTDCLLPHKVCHSVTCCHLVLFSC